VKIIFTCVGDRLLSDRGELTVSIMITELRMIHIDRSKADSKYVPGGLELRQNPSWRKTNQHVGPR